MRCLYCGRELGFLQELKDGEFCSKAHRGRYVKLTRKGLARLLEPEPKAPTPVEERKRRRGGFRKLHLEPLPVGQRMEVAELEFLRQLIALASPSQLSSLTTASGKGLPRALNPLTLQLPARPRPSTPLGYGSGDLRVSAPILPAHVMTVTALPLPSAPPKPVTLRAEASRSAGRPSRTNNAAPSPRSRKRPTRRARAPLKRSAAMRQRPLAVLAPSPVFSKAARTVMGAVAFPDVQPAVPGLNATATQALRFGGPVTAVIPAPAIAERFPLAYREISMEPKPQLPGDSGLGVVGGLPRFLQPPPSNRVSGRWKNRWHGVPRLVRVAASLAVLIALGALALPIRKVAHAAENAWASLVEGVENRAAVEFVEDFNSGFQSWEGGRNWDRSWSIRREGYVHPGRLAIYTPSVMLTDYRFEFLGQIDRRAISWVYRAADLENYYVARVVVRKPGLRPTLSLVRHSVVNGKNTGLVERPLRLLLHNDTPYRFTLTARGNQFSITAAGVELDSWTDTALRAGGVGFFTERGERSRIYWMHLAYQDDVAGRLCRRIAPALPLGFLTAAGPQK